MKITKSEKEFFDRTEHKRNRAQIEAAKASVKQAEASQNMAQEAAKQTEIVQRTEALKQEEILKKQQLEARVHNVKKIIASLTFQISDVELAEGNDKIEKFLKINHEFKTNISQYREELIELGETSLIENLIDFEKKLKIIRNSIEGSPKSANYIELKESSKELGYLIQAKESVENKISEVDTIINKNTSFKKNFSLDYCNIFGINQDELNKREIENKIRFPKPGTFIMLIRRLLLFIGFISIAGFVAVYTDENSQNGDDVLILVVIAAALMALIAAFVGRKTIKKRNEISKLEKDYKTLKINEENDKSNVMNLNEQKNKQKDLSSSIDLLTKKLDKLKKEGLKLGNDVT